MNRISVLLVEDEAIVSADIQDRLKAFGYTVGAATDTGADALRLAVETKADLVLMDINLNGELDGIETAGLIRERLDLPVVYLSAYSDAETLERAKLTQPYGYLLKPLEERELVTTIEMAVYKHRAERERERLLHDLEKALEEVKTLRGLLPICCECKKIRGEDGDWEQLEAFVTARTDATFSHGYCPECYLRAVKAVDDAAATPPAAED
jgi:two-component system, response regulator PdtaR